VPGRHDEEIAYPSADVGRIAVPLTKKLKLKELDANIAIWMFREREQARQPRCHGVAALGSGIGLDDAHALDARLLQEIGGAFRSHRHR
jgi:hypothetical protein